MNQTMTSNAAPRYSADGIELHDETAFAGMRRAGRLAAEVLDFITPHVVPGVPTEELDKLCHDYIIKNKAIPAPLNYKGFPKSICTSINHVVCHGIPGTKRLMEGDIVNIDVTVILDGWYGDTSRMFGAGKVPVKAQRLMDVTHESMMAGIRAVRPGATLGDVGFACQQVAEAAHFSVVRDFCGHGIGKTFHAAPSVLHYGQPGTGPRLVPGMFFTIEPMVNAGTWQTKVLTDGWTAVTRDKSLSAQYEHTVGVTEDGVEIFTESPRGWHKAPYA